MPTIPSHPARLIPEVHYGSSETAGLPHRGSKMCILATGRAGTRGRSGRSGENKQEHELVTAVKIHDRSGL